MSAAVFPAMVEGSMEGTLSGAPLLVLCLLGFVTLAWAAASGKAYRGHAEDDRASGNMRSSSSQTHSCTGGCG